MLAAPSAAILLLLAALPPDAPRHEIDLGGAWECQQVAELAEPPKSGAWRPCQVPGYLQGHDYQRAWLRRRFDAPRAMQGRRIKLCFEGVKFNSRVYLNGIHVGGCFGGYQPFELDVTNAVRFDGPNELAVGCHDWTGVFTPGRVDFAKADRWNDVRGVPRDKILSPIGGLYGLYGIWGDVKLHAHPAVYVKDLFVKPSVRRGELVVDYTLANESDQEAEVELRAAVEERGQDATTDVLRLGPASLNVPAGKTASATLRRPWAGPRLWSHVDPHLYHLRTELRGGDLLRTRFGFREFWVQEHRFYLNGVPVNLLATSWWPPHEPMAREEVRRRWEAVKRCGCIAFRTHTQPWPGIHYDVADELGLLMIVEGAVWNDRDAYRINDPVFWDNYAAHLRAMVDRDKNRPSVVMWSLENEFYGGRLNDAAPAKKDLVRMGRLVKQHDPTRPIYYESDGDPDGVADVVGIHYPHEYPQYTCWPNEADWLRSPQKLGVGLFNSGRPEFFWDKKKPLYVGEFLWIPSSDPSWHTVFFGDEAYTDYRRYHGLAKAEAWKMQILGYRRREVAGISPWTVIEGGPLDETNPLYQAHQYAYQPIAAYCLDYDRRFFAGETVRRRVEVFNDVMEPSQLTLEWRLTVAGNEADHGQERLDLGAAEHRTIDFAMHLPPVDRRTPARLRLVLLRGKTPVFDDPCDYAVFPRRPLARPDAARFGLYDPRGETRKALAAAGLDPPPVASLTGVPGTVEVLLIGAGTLAAEKPQTPVIGRLAPERAALAGFLGRGGRVLVLEQAAYPAGMFDCTLTGHRSTMTFPLAGGHPALAGVPPEDLRFWRGDHLVASAEPPRPVEGGGRAIVVSGSVAGIDHAPLLERSMGRGCVVHCQLKLVEKLDAEPAARQILANLLDYLAGYRPVSGKTAVLGASPQFCDYLRGLGLRFDDVTAKAAGRDLSAYRLVVCRGKIEDAAGLRTFVDRGGSLLAHRTAPADLATLNRVFGLDLSLRHYAGELSRAEGDDPLLGAIAREDLYWLGRHVGIGWAETPRAAKMTDGIFSKTLDGKEVRFFEVEDWELEGGLVEKRSPGAVFATVGSAAAEVDFPETGDYVIGVVARGTPCKGVYPIVRVSIDGRWLGTIGVADEQWRTTTTFGRVEQGRHRLAIAFVNDASDPPREDRNLHVDKVLVARDAGASGLRLLTSPPAAAVARRGGGTVVVDQIRWDSEQENARKAARYAASLLAALGGDFTPRQGTAISCATMTPQQDMPFFHNNGTHVALSCNGYLKTPVEVAAAGRYTMELVASGTAALDVYPLVEVRLDGRKLGQVQLTGGAWRSYWIEVDLPAGRHELALAFVNDFSTATEDRNVMLDRAVFHR
jgi:beta-galactosidase